jgi:hypothetical protein
MGPAPFRTDGTMSEQPFTVTRVSPTRIEITLDGKIDEEQMVVALDALVAETEGIDGGEMLFRVHDFTLPTLGAVNVEFARLPSMLGWIRKFSRCAVLADQGWLKAISELEGALIPGVEIKGFGLDEEDAANAWLSRPTESG